jgi:hypothetical protein
MLAEDWTTNPEEKGPEVCVRTLTRSRLLTAQPFGLSESP